MLYQRCEQPRREKGEPRSGASADDHSAAPIRMRGSAGRSIARQPAPRQRSRFTARRRPLPITGCRPPLPTSSGPTKHSASGEGPQPTRHRRVPCQSASRTPARRRSPAPSVQRAGEIERRAGRSRQRDLARRAGRRRRARERGSGSAPLSPGHRTDRSQLQLRSGESPLMRAEGRRRAPPRAGGPRPKGCAAGYAIGSLLRNGRLSQLLPAATMQLRPAGVVLTTVQVPLFSEA
jgi:hypothetical protein